ncbi:Retrotransposon gag domain [Sesbania bispinosa]|nr:Retrotransposon gag domain [Sesbania bispinosa]
MESRVENLEKSMLEWKHESQIQMEEIKQLLKEKNRGYTRGRSRQRRSPKRRTEGESQGSRAVSSRVSEPRSKTRDSLRGSRPPRGDYRGRKLEIPIFSGDDAYGWINRVERYFKVNDMDDCEKLGAVLVALEDRALNWYHWWEEQTPSPSWVQFKEAVIRRFQPELVQNPFGPLLSIKQTGTVMEYREKFEMISAPLKNADRVMLKGIFLNGLREELQAELKLYNMESL